MPIFIIYVEDGCIDWVCVNVGQCGWWVNWGNWDMWELVGICSRINWRFSYFYKYKRITCLENINNGFYLERQTDWKTKWRYACYRCGHRRTSQWFGSDPKLCCVRELNMGRVPFTLNFAKAKTHPKQRGDAIYFFLNYQLSHCLVYSSSISWFCTVHVLECFHIPSQSISATFTC